MGPQILMKPSDNLASLHQTPIKLLRDNFYRYLHNESESRDDPFLSDLQWWAENWLNITLRDISKTKGGKTQ